MSIFKSLVNLTTTAGVAGLVTFSPIFTLKSEALTEDQALERLSLIPVFAIINDKGVVMPFSLPKQPNAKPDDSQLLWRFFLGPEEAEIALKDTQKQLSPEIGKKLMVSADSLGNVLKTVGQLKDKKVAIDIVPSKANFEAAKAVLSAKGSATNGIPPVPVFFLTQGEKEDPVILSDDLNQNGKIDQGEPQTLRFFIDKSDLQDFLDQQNKLNPAVTKNTKIQVTSMFNVLEVMISKDNKPNLGSEIIRFIPSRISQEYIDKAVKQSSTSTPQPTPSKSVQQATPPKLNPNTPKK